MENKIIYDIAFSKPVEFSFKQEKFTLEGDGMRLTIMDKHKQDCCEAVYADWPGVYPFKDTYKRMQIKSVKNMGFLICMERSRSYEADWWDKLFVACYDEQSGYYRDDLMLIVTVNDEEKVIDISELVEHRIY